MKYRSYSRALKNHDLIVITEWNRLAHKKPSVGELCIVRTVPYRYEGATSIGNYVESNGVFGFAQEHGLLITNPEETYWIPMPTKEPK